MYRSVMAEKAKPRAHGNRQAPTETHVRARRRNEQLQQGSWREFWVLPAPQQEVVADADHRRAAARGAADRPRRLSGRTVHLHAVLIAASASRCREVLPPRTFPAPPRLPSTADPRTPRAVRSSLTPCSPRHSFRGSCTTRSRSTGLGGGAAPWAPVPKLASNLNTFDLRLHETRRKRRGFFVATPLPAGEYDDRIGAKRG